MNSILAGSQVNTADDSKGRQQEKSIKNHWSKCILKVLFLDRLLFGISRRCSSDRGLSVRVEDNVQ